MSGGKSRPKVQAMESPDPAPQPIPGREIDKAKKKVRRGRGRQQNILAGRLMAGRNVRLGDSASAGILKMKLGGP